VNFYFAVLTQLASHLLRGKPVVILSLGRIVIKYAVCIVCVSRQIEHPAASFGLVGPAILDPAVLNFLAVDTFELDLTNVSP